MRCDREAFPATLPPRERPSGGPARNPNSAATGRRPPRRWAKGPIRCLPKRSAEPRSGERNPAAVKRARHVHRRHDGSSPRPSPPPRPAGYLTGAIPVSGTAGTAPAIAERSRLRLCGRRDHRRPGRVGRNGGRRPAPGRVPSRSCPGCVHASGPAERRGGQRRHERSNTDHGAGAAPAPPPSASFTWFPEQPRVGRNRSRSSRAPPTRARRSRSFAWGLTATEPFHPGHATTTTTFATPGAHVVRLQVTDAAGRSATASRRSWSTIRRAR